MKNQKGNVEVMMLVFTIFIVLGGLALLFMIGNEIVFKSNEKKEVFYRGKVEIINKEFKKSYSETYLMPAGKSVIPMTRTIPEKYLISFKLPFKMPKKLENKLETDKNFYESKEVGDSFNVTIYSYSGYDLLRFNRIEYELVLNKY